jgi:tRNA (guanine-N(7)-)-methyltransferase subunit TRM82
MPKRLCAIKLTRNQSTLLAGDKFGDVYALPLHPSCNPSAVSARKPQLETPRLLKPSASELTVHTKGNLEALRQQQLQKASVSKKQRPAFEHQLILGHVSLLTDLVVGTDTSNGNREYILTADRDEHIRVSRGLPQAHVINNYCLGHKEFVSKLYIIPELPQFLISGGGEPSIRIYDWMRSETVEEANLEENMKGIFATDAFNDLSKPDGKRAISCIQALYIGGTNETEDVVMIMLALEGYAFFCNTFQARKRHG